MIFQIDNWVFWAILMVGIVAYSMIFDVILSRDELSEQRWKARLSLIAGFLTTLPLLGLLGTIMGLLDTFAMMAHESIDYEAMIAGGVGTALGTTQLGLLLAVPGLLMHHFVSREDAQLRAEEEADDAAMDGAAHV